MSFDIKIGVNKSYELPIKLNTHYKGIVNSEKYELSDSIIITKVTDHTISVTNDEKFITNYVCAQQIDNVSVKDSSVPSETNWKYLIKSDGSYSYQKEKPKLYDNLTYEDFYFINGKDIRDSSVSKILSKSVKAIRGLIHTSGTTVDAWMIFSFPFGGISKTTPYLYYSSNFIIKELKESETVKVDLLEGMVYIKQNHPDTIDQVFGYFDVEPLKLTTQDYFKIDGKDEDTFCKIVQRNSFGEINVREINEDAFIVQLSYNAFIVSSDPYFVSVDGVNLLNPRYIPKNTPILVEQSFNKERESFLESYLTLFNGIESKEISQLTTFIKHDSTSSVETFSEKSVSSGLFIYKEVEEGSFDTTHSTYLPLFNPQNIVKEHN